MPLSSIVKGTDWRGTLTVKPDSGETEADVITALTGATVAFTLRSKGLVIATGTASVLDASARTVEIQFTDVETAAIAKGRHDIETLVTTAASEIIPLILRNRLVEVVDF